ncbi:MAG: hypothetical protein Q7S74_02460 [Nanoarchaeota archaeon]|nr:hypothetical protein [Nanoarchaeota archaeon]
MITSTIELLARQSGVSDYDKVETEELESVLREYLSKQINIIGGFRIFKRYQGIIELVSLEKPRGGFVIVQDQSYKLKNKQTAEYYKNVVKSKILREFVDHDKKLAGFSWRNE